MDLYVGSFLVKEAASKVKADRLVLSKATHKESEDPLEQTSTRDFSCPAVTPILFELWGATLVGETERRSSVAVQARAVDSPPRPL
jgi:hypothetical protein